MTSYYLAGNNSLLWFSTDDAVWRLVNEDIYIFKVFIIWKITLSTGEPGQRSRRRLTNFKPIIPKDTQTESCWEKTWALPITDSRGRSYGAVNWLTEPTIKLQCHLFHMYHKVNSLRMWFCSDKGSFLLIWLHQIQPESNHNRRRRKKTSRAQHSSKKDRLWIMSWVTCRVYQRSVCALIQLQCIANYLF